MNMITEIRENLGMEIRPNSLGSEYLEAVVRRDDIEKLRSLLTNHLGPAAKEPGKEANFPTKIRTLVDSMGGLRIKQSFFFKQQDDHTVVYAALWPWESNPEKITLKAGVGLV
ncbi:MAG TPA: hypothetical protein VLK23_07145 [Thermodesulfobacteriota bacterium]|nr:hypothetical protein [Thermodesulfobacteriota bacterium]